MGEKLDKISEKLGLSYPQPDAEPETAWIFQHMQKTADGKYKVPTEWTQDAKGNSIPSKYSEPMDQREFNRFVFRANIEVLNTKLQPYKAIKDIYNKEIEAVKLRLKAGNLDFSKDDENRKAVVERIKLMWEQYETRFRNKKHTQEAKDFRETILAVMRTVPTKGNIETHHQGKFRKIYYDVNQVAALVAQKKQPAPQITAWEGDLKKLIDFYEGEVDYMEDKFMEPLNKKIEANKEWSKK